MLLTGLATLGVSAWGLAESIMSTDTTVSDFWVVIQDIHGIVSWHSAACTALQSRPCLEPVPARCLPLGC